MGNIRKLTKVAGPLVSEEIKVTWISKSQKLFSELGLIQFNNGLGALSPMLVKSLSKLKTLVRAEMEQISASEFLLPILTPPKLFKASGRIDLPDLFKVEQKSEEERYILSPTCEESAANFIKSFPNLSQKNLPYRLYQISPKFRDERRAKSGLLRSKEFWMKDLYCFDSDLKSSEKCYEEVIKSYQNLFEKLQVPYVCVRGFPGDIGGLYSHEFHFLSDAGEDEIFLCQDCESCENFNFINNPKHQKCQKCGSSNVQISKGIEVGHAFNLGTTYTEKLNAQFKDSNSNFVHLHMSCFGLGLTRILAASVETLCTPAKIIWPAVLAPYLICILPPKSGSIEEKAAERIPEQIYHNLNECLHGDVVVDDRTSLTIGTRMKYVEKIGFPYAVIVGKTISKNPPLVEVVDVYNNTRDFIQVADVSQYILNKLHGDNLNQSIVNKEKSAAN